MGLCWSVGADEPGERYRAKSNAGHDGVLVVELRSGRRIEVRRGFDAGRQCDF